MSDDFRLEFFWEEVESDEKAGHLWGQLAGSLYRLKTISEELDALAASDDMMDISLGLSRLAYHVENYFSRLYELRERALGLLAEITKNKAATQKLRHPDQRQEAAAILEQVAPMPTRVLMALLDLINDDIGLRNIHTHDTFLSLGVYTGDDVFDPQDVLVGLQRHPDALARLTALLRREMKRMATFYSGKVDKVVASTWPFLEHAQPIVR